MVDCKYSNFLSFIEVVCEQQVSKIQYTTVDTFIIILGLKRPSYDVLKKLCIVN